MVLDAENPGYDRLNLDGCPPELAGAQIDGRSNQCEFDVEVAKRGLAEQIQPRSLWNFHSGVS